MSMQNEKWFQSRRVWAAVLTALAVVSITAMPEQYELVAAIMNVGAIALGLTSWTMPKQ